MTIQTLYRRDRGPSATTSFTGLSPRLVIEGSLLILSTAMSWALSAVVVHPFWSVVAVFNYLWMITVLFRIEPRAVALELPQLVTRASVVVSLVFIEYGSPIPELAIVGQPGPQSSAYVFYMLLLFTIYAIVFRIVAGPVGRDRHSTLTPLYDRYANMIAAGVLALLGLITVWMILRGLGTGFPLLTGTDRFAYRRMSGDKITVYALNLKFVILFVLGMIAFVLPVNRLLRIGAMALAVISLIVYFLFADKFFTQLVAISGFLGPYLYYNYSKIIKYFAYYALAAGMALSLVFSVTWYIYSNGYTVSTAATMQKLGGRIVGQGELWYLQSKIGAPMVHWDENFVNRNIEALKVKDVETFAVQNSLGPNYFSNRYAPDNIRAAIERNAGTVTFTAAFEALGLFAFGWFGLVLMVALEGAILALVTWYGAYAVTSRSLLSGAFASYAMTMYRYAIVQGTLWVFASIYTGKWLVVIAALEIALYTFGLALRPSGRPHANARTTHRRPFPPAYGAMSRASMGSRRRE